MIDLSRRNLLWWTLAIVAASILWWIHVKAPHPKEMGLEILDDLKFRFPVPQVPNPWRR
jgi:hypothetical protein